MTVGSRITAAESSHARQVLAIPATSAANSSSERVLLTADVVQRAYRRRALEMHPDKPGGSVEAFRRLGAARDTLLRQLQQPPRGGAGGPAATDGGAAAPQQHVDPTGSAVRSARTGAAPVNGSRRRSTTTGAPPPFAAGSPAKPFPAMLADGTMYMFDVSPAAFGCSGLSHGDVVRRLVAKKRPGTADTATTTEAEGVVVGVASNGVAYWWPRGGAHGVAAVPFGPLHGPHAVSFSRPAMQPNKANNATTSSSTPRAAPRSSAATTTMNSATAPPPARCSAAASASTSSLFDERASSSTASWPSSAASPVSATLPAGSNSAKTSALRALSHSEALARGVFCAAVSAFYEQASWIHRLPQYAAVDQRYNAEFL